MPYRGKGGEFLGYKKEMGCAGGKAKTHAVPGPGTISGDVYKPMVSGKAGKRRRFVGMGRTPKQVYG